MDLEASVADEEEEDDDIEDEWDLGNIWYVYGIFTDDSTDGDDVLDEPEAANSVISHAQLALEYDHASESVDCWDSFLERALSRALSQEATRDEASYHESRTFVGQVPIWKIPVKVRLTILPLFPDTDIDSRKGRLGRDNCL